MVFLFFENIQRTPSPGFAPCQSPRGHTITPHRMPPQARETVNPYKHTPTNKSPGKRPTTPHNASRTQRHKQPNNPRRRTRRTPDTMHPHPRTTQARDTFTSVQGLPRIPGRLFLIMFYVYRAAVHARKSPGI